MTYKVILNHLDSSAATAARTELSCSLAKQQAAHLVGLAATGIPLAAVDSDAGKSLSAQTVQQINLDAQQAIIGFEQQCQQADVPSFESRRVANKSLDAIRWHERFCDLILIGRETPQAKTGLSPLSFTEQVLLAATRPVLIVPSIITDHIEPLRAAIAWDGSASAARAIMAGIPALQGAASVDIVIVHKTGAEAMDEGTAGSELLLYLSRHGIRAHITECELIDDVAATLLAHVRETAANLLIMGGYGHTRLRERLLGGATRKILMEMSIPVLMKH